MNPYSGYGEGFMAYDDEDFFQEDHLEDDEQLELKGSKLSKEHYECMLLGLNFKQSNQLNLTQYDAMLMGLLR